MAVAYAGYEFSGWVNGNDETEILGTNASIKLAKSVVNGKIVKAVFVKKVNSNTNSTTDDGGMSGLM